ncbi:hypothetical protein ACE1B6_22870 [Aerosakkonemataceae cyanobacterium BLCC-F154]|uniref:Uncharacterized protein n=1 Tax=Floridaenema fluviatile BLCC-F154 TaxID=3153640 RepID=A0ABV4YHX9_9CYAN
MNRLNFLPNYLPYQGELTWKNLAFNANLQEFAGRVNWISELANTGEISPEESFNQIELLWEKLTLSKEQLGIGGAR